MRAPWLLVVSCVLALTACSGSGKKAAPAATPPASPRPAPTAAATPAPSVTGVPAPPPGALGAACTQSETSMAGSCGAGLLCAPTPGGMCAAFCGPTAPPGMTCGGTCAETLRMGQVCLAPCGGDADCRSAEGYLCDPTWKACALPGMLAPRPPSCPDLPRARKLFAAPRQLSTAQGPGLYHIEPAAALSRGTLVVAYGANTGTGRPNPIGLASLAPDGTLDIDRTLPDARENHFDNWMASAADGSLHLVWLGFDGGRAPEKNMQIGYATSRDAGKSWTTARAPHTELDCPAGTPGCLDKPMIAIGPARGQKGEAMYVVYEASLAEKMMLVRSLDGGASFTTTSVPVLEAGYGDLEVSSDGIVHVVGGTGTPRMGLASTPEHHVLYTSSSDGGQTFAPPTQVSAADEPIPFFFKNPQVAADPKRKLLYAVYATGGADARWDIRLATSKDAGRTWSRITVNDDSCANHMIPTLAVDAKTGRAHVLYLDSRDGGRAMYAACDAGGARCGPPEAVSDRFSHYGFCRHCSTWLSEYPSLLIDPARRTLHALWTQPVREGEADMSRIFQASARLR